MKFDLYRHPDDEQDAWRSLRAEALERETVQQQATPQSAARIAELHDRYPWMPLGVKLALALGGADDETAEFAAFSDARRKSRAL